MAPPCRFLVTGTTILQCRTLAKAIRMSEADGLRWEKVCASGDVPDGAIKPVKVGALRLAVCNVGGEVRLVDNACPHRGGPLARGKLVGAELVCPWHQFRFDPATGRATMPTDLPAATTYPVRVADGSVMIGIDDSIRSGV